MARRRRKDKKVETEEQSKAEHICIRASTIEQNVEILSQPVRP
jgi:hypothetical protein